MLEQVVECIRTRNTLGIRLPRSNVGVHRRLGAILALFALGSQTSALATQGYKTNVLFVIGPARPALF